MVRIEQLDSTAWTRLRSVRLAALADTPEAFGSTLDGEEAYDEAAWLELLTSPWWVAVTDLGEDVGLVAGARRRDDGVPWVFSMWVAPSWRGRDVGRALLDAVVGWASGEGASTLGLDVADRVPRARRFYERYGFVENGHVFDMPRDPSIRLAEMTLTLRAADG